MNRRPSRDRSDMRDWNVEVAGPGQRWGRYAGLLEDWNLRLSHDLILGQGRRWYAVITSCVVPSRKFTGLGKSQHEAFAKAVAALDKETQR